MEVDQLIVGALQLYGRATWKAIANAIGVPESTVARRGPALIESRIVTVVGVIDPLRCGTGVPVQVRLRCHPGRAAFVAESLSSSPAARFVTLLTGLMVDIAAEIVVPSHRDIDDMLSVALSLSGDVVEAETLFVLRQFSVVEEWNPRVLSETASEELIEGSLYATSKQHDWSEPHRLSEHDLAIAQLLAGDGRATFRDVAGQLGISESTAKRRVEALVHSGRLRLRAVFEPSVIGLDVEFIQWLTVDPSALQDVALALASQPCISYVCATTGRFDLYVHGAVPSYGDLYNYLVNTVGSLIGVITVETSLQTRSFKRAWVRIDADGKSVRAA